MAPPRAFPMLTCFSDDAASVPDAVAAKETTHGSEKRQRQRRRRWTGEIKRKILAATRRPRIWAVREEEEQPCDDLDVVKQSAQAPPPKLQEQLQQAAPPRRREGARPVSQRDRSPSNNGGAPDAVAVVGRGHLRARFALPPEEMSAAPVEPRLPTGVLAVDGRRKKKGLRVRFDLPPEEMIAAPPPVQPRFPSGVLGQPPESFEHSDADMTAAFLMSVIAEKGRGTDSATATQVDRGLVARWTERKAACSRRLSYLRDYCPFQREEEEEAEDGEDEESAPETTTTRPEAEPGHAEVRPVKTGLPFDSAESEAEFVKAIRSRYLRKDDFLSRHAYERSREQKSLMAAGEV